MDDQQLISIFDQLEKYLDEKKIFIQDNNKIKDFRMAVFQAEQLFSESKVTIGYDPIQMGACILQIEGSDMVIQGDQESLKFQKIISKADNFEIYPTAYNKIKFSAVFRNVFRKI